MVRLSWIGFISSLIVISVLINGIHGDNLNTNSNSDDLSSTIESKSSDNQEDVRFSQLEDISKHRQLHPSEIFNVYLVQKADGRRELCFPLNFTDSFASLADKYLLENNLSPEAKPSPVPTPSSLSPIPTETIEITSRKRRSITWAFRRLLILKRKVINTLLFLL
ncbi:uncharacterized protein LOC128390398 [Panonychus citri]|uniref:uncharacterized protein LOC128390398 n=1 Tax=Panonychus citri TaxID=50023 RepID=UPI0023070DBB|nr:uncharacterized protein LOC128390398 [Panonychus citri]